MNNLTESPSQNTGRRTAILATAAAWDRPVNPGGAEAPVRPDIALNPAPPGIPVPATKELQTETILPIFETKKQNTETKPQSPTDPMRNPNHPYNANPPAATQPLWRRRCAAKSEISNPEISHSRLPQPEIPPLPRRGFKSEGGIPRWRLNLR